MRAWLGKTARSPLFLRIFVLMLMCAGVIQLMNLALLVAAQTPTDKLYTVGHVADALKAGEGDYGELTVSKVRSARTSGWTPRLERTQLAFAMATGGAPDDFRISFDWPLFSGSIAYDRSSVPRVQPPPSAAAARDLVITGAFSAAWRQPDGSWLRVQPSGFMEPWRWYVIGWLVVSVIAVIPFAWSLARRFAEPFGVFAAAAERLGRDPRAPPLEWKGPAEIADTAAAFNQMQARLNRYVDDRATVVGAVAHDLRTPLMRLSLRLEAAPEPLRAACEADIRDMQAMLSATMSYVRDTGGLVERRPLDLRSLAESVIDEMSDRGDDVVLRPGAPLVIEGHPPALKAVVANLVSNAIKYAGSAEVSLARQGGQAVLEVSDCGPGMPPEDLDRAFEPFFRSERSRNRNTGGIGLGLPSVRAVARAHGGDAELHAREGGGLVARVSLPL